MNIRKLDPIFPLDKNANKGYNGLKQEPISALAPDVNSLYDPEHTENYDEESILFGTDVKL